MIRRTQTIALAAGLAALTWLAVAPAHVAQTTQRTQPQKAAPASNTAESIQLNNLGVARMNRQQAEEALKLFERAYALDPKLYAARLNQGIALLNLQHYDSARKILEEATSREPSNPRGWYNLGLLERAQGHAETAIAAFDRAAALDVNDADAQYFLGLLYSQLQQYDKAIAAYQRAIKTSPFHVSAEFGLAQAYQRRGDTAHAKEHLARFQHLTQEKLGVPMSLAYGQQGKYSLAEQVTRSISPVPPPIPVHFVDVTREAGLPTQGVAAPTSRANEGLKYLRTLGAGACVINYDGDGRPDLVLVNADGSGRLALFHNLGNGKFEVTTQESGIKAPGQGIACAVGDYDNDGRPDLALSYNGGVVLLHNEGKGAFRDVTTAAGIHVSGLAQGLTFVDYDHDSDLDLYVTRASEVAWSDPPPPPAKAPNLLLRNNGNGTFTDVTPETGLGGPGPSVAVLASDINNDRAIDFVVTGWLSPPVAFLNPREGKFKAVEPWFGPMPDSTAGVVALDFDKDGWMDLAFTHAEMGSSHRGEPALSLWRNVEGKKFEPVALPKLDLTIGWGVAALDYDNDGWIDLVAVGENAQGGQIVLLRNEGPAGFRDVTKATALDKIKLKNPRAVIPFDFDGDGATDLLITQSGGPPILLRNIGGNKNNWIRLSLKGEHDNKSAIGTKVEVFAGALHQKWEITGASGYLGQSSTDIIAGLGSEKQADIVRLLWPTGVLQDEVSLAARQRHEIVEIDRRGSSCPIVFVWNGSRFEFLADVVGPGIVGHWVGPGQRNVPDPTEYLKVDGARVRPRNGRLSFRVLEPMEELDYLDQVRLLAVDHPADIEVYPNEYFASNPPFPEFKVIAVRGAHLPAGAWDDQGRDVLPLLAQRDRHYVTDFPDAPYQGFAVMHSLTLELRDWDASRPLLLLLDGFTDYFTANSMYAAWQAGITPVAPYVEALDRSGRWVRVVDDMGFPAGLARTMVADLTGKLPAGTRRIRITTNLKVYWDRIRIDNAPSNLPYHLTEVPMAGAKLDFRGYPRVVEGNPKNDLLYVYEDVSPTAPYTRQMGNYTRYGDVRELLTAADDEYVIFGSGDEIAVDFDPTSLPHLPPGWTRDYFFFANGFAKDMDFYAAYGDTVAPLPFHTLVPYPYPAGTEYPFDLRHREYLLRYNTRPVSGPPGSSYRFQYPKK